MRQSSCFSSFPVMNLTAGVGVLDWTRPRLPKTTLNNIHVWILKLLKHWFGLSGKESQRARSGPRKSLVSLACLFTSFEIFYVCGFQAMQRLPQLHRNWTDFSRMLCFWAGWWFSSSTATGSTSQLVQNVGAPDVWWRLWSLVAVTVGFCNIL